MDTELLILGLTRPCPPSRSLWTPVQTPPNYKFPTSLFRFNSLGLLSSFPQCLWIASNVARMLSENRISVQVKSCSLPWNKNILATAFPPAGWCLLKMEIQHFLVMVSQPLMGLSWDLGSSNLISKFHYYLQPLGEGAVETYKLLTRIYMEIAKSSHMFVNEGPLRLN